MWEYNHMPRPDELYHWKYIKREKIDGKYRYWYADTEKPRDPGKSRFGKYSYTYDKKTGYNVLTREDRRKQDWENFKAGIEYKLGYNERAAYQDAKKKYNNGEALTPEEKTKLSDAYEIYLKGDSGTPKYKEAEKRCTNLQENPTPTRLRLLLKKDMRKRQRSTLIHQWVRWKKPQII